MNEINFPSNICYNSQDFAKKYLSSLPQETSSKSILQKQAYFEYAHHLKNTALLCTITGITCLALVGVGWFLACELNLSYPVIFLITYASIGMFTKTLRKTQKWFNQFTMDLRIHRHNYLALTHLLENPSLFENPSPTSPPLSGLLNHEKASLEIPQTKNSNFIPYNEVSYENLPGSTPEERENITSLFHDLGTWSYASIIWNKTTINERGDEIVHIHPLKMLGILFSNPKMKKPMQALSNSSILKPQILTSFSEGIEIALKEKNVYQHLEAFSQEIKIEEEILKPFFDNHNWEELLDYLVLNTFN